jgi:four helix bundle protein
MGHFKDLRAWQHARRLALLSKEAITRLPAGERDGLIDQWRRASYSVVLNIAEGASMRGSREFRKYLDTARGSLHEIEAIMDLVVGLGYLTEDDLRDVEAARAECAKTVYGLIRKFSGPDSPSG